MTSWPSGRRRRRHQLIDLSRPTSIPKTSDSFISLYVVPVAALDFVFLHHKYHFICICIGGCNHEHLGFYVYPHWANVNFPILSDYPIYGSFLRANKISGHCISVKNESISQILIDQ